MVDIRRIDRINNLIREIDPKGKGVDEEADEATALDAERAICRAAARILALSPENIEEAAESMEGLIYEVSVHPTAEESRIILALRHFAELAKEE